MFGVFFCYKLMLSAFYGFYEAQMFENFFLILAALFAISASEIKNLRFHKVLIAISSLLLITTKFVSM